MHSLLQLRNLSRRSWEDYVLRCLVGINISLNVRLVHGEWCAHSIINCTRLWAHSVVSVWWYNLEPLTQIVLDVYGTQVFEPLLCENLPPLCAPEDSDSASLDKWAGQKVNPDLEQLRDLYSANLNKEACRRVNLRYWYSATVNEFGCQYICSIKALRSRHNTARALRSWACPRSWI